MKKNYYLFVFIIFSLLIIFLFALNIFLPKENYPGYQIIDYKLRGKSHHLLVADTSVKWEKGLMNYKKLKGVDGMIFIFPDKRIRNFWNKNTYLDLDIYWLNDDQVVGKTFLPSIKKNKDIIIVTSPEMVNKVIELVK